jgi:hypothetical protein
MRKADSKPETLPYYTVFNRMAEQERDLRELEEKITKLQIILNAEL